MPIRKIFGIESSPDGFISNFSLEEEKNKIAKDSYHLHNEIAILVKASRKLNNPCPEWDTFKQKNESLIINNLIDFISTIKNEIETKDLLNLYIFTNEVFEIESLEDGNIIEQIEIKYFKNDYSNYENNTTDIIKIIGLLFNKINNKNFKKSKNGRFLRIILITDENSNPIKIDNLISVMKTFSSSNRNYENAVLNILTIEECENIKNLKNDELYKKICDNSNINDSIDISNNEINEIYDIIKYKDKKFYNEVEEINSKNIDYLSKDVLNKFIGHFDESYIDIQNLNNAILNNLSLLNEIKNHTKKNKIQNEIRDEVIEKNLINKVIEKVKGIVQENKNDINDWEKDFKKAISDSQKNIEDLKSEFNINLDNDYWNKKYDFIQHKIENIENFNNKIININSFLDYVNDEISKNAEKAIESPQ